MSPCERASAIRSEISIRLGPFKSSSSETSRRCASGVRKVAGFSIATKRAYQVGSFVPMDTKLTRFSHGAG